ncbi:hypothetical protein EV421DRAFT_1262417 [Armillaria borealis]|uniref:Uncharacterized protein n=1 Tax=Armillaria borealis TaxID=47425 RepID=A0AA39J3S0_9AGAR|nr:hypothetical protein EV421DRAFT_1262417 [Armillaria borealis]
MIGKSRTEQRKCIRRFWKINHDFLNPNGRPIKIGDFGEMDKETLSFQHEGNIFEHPDSKDIMARWSTQVIGVSTVDQVFQHTGNVRRIDLPVGVGAGLTGTVEGNVTAQFQFTKKRAVLLCMYDVKHSVLPVFKNWIKDLSEIPLFKAKVVVTQAHTCSHYDLAMQTQGNRAVGMTVNASSPIPVAPAITASADVGFHVSDDAGAHLSWRGRKSAECDSFVPMYHARRIAAPRSGISYYVLGDPTFVMDYDDSGSLSPPSPPSPPSPAAEYGSDVSEEFAEPVELDDAPPAPLAPSSDMHGVPVYEEFSEPGEPVEHDDASSTPLSPSSVTHDAPVYENFDDSKFWPLVGGLDEYVYPCLRLPFLIYASQCFSTMERPR